MCACLFDSRQLGRADLVTLAMAVHGDDLRWFEPVKYVGRMGDDDLLIALAAQEIGGRALAGWVKMEFRFIDR
jgi:hypothetical protein